MLHPLRPADRLLWEVIFASLGKTITSLRCSAPACGRPPATGGDYFASLGKNNYLPTLNGTGLRADRLLREVIISLRETIEPLVKIRTFAVTAGIGG